MLLLLLLHPIRNETGECRVELQDQNASLRLSGEGNGRGGHRAGQNGWFYVAIGSKVLAEGSQEGHDETGRG